MRIDRGSGGIDLICIDTFRICSVVEGAESETARERSYPSKSWVEVIFSSIWENQMEWRGVKEWRCKRAEATCKRGCPSTIDDCTAGLEIKIVYGMKGKYIAVMSQTSIITAYIAYLHNGP